jgi:hypothetical protein
MGCAERTDMDIKKVSLVQKKWGIEVLVLELVVEKWDGTVSRQDIDLGGNGTVCAAWGANSVVAALQSMLLFNKPADGGDIAEGC